MHHPPNLIPAAGEDRRSLGARGQRKSPRARNGKPDPVDVYVGERIKLRRQMIAVSQTELADAIGLTFQQVQKYESGHNRVSASRLWDIASALRCPVAFFFDGLGRAELHARPDVPELISEISDPFADSQVLELAMTFSRIRDVDLRVHVLALVAKLRRGED